MFFAGGVFPPQSNIRGEQRSVEGGRESPFEKRESDSLNRACADSDLSSDGLYPRAGSNAKELVYPLIR